MDNYVDELIRHAITYEASDLFLAEGSVPRMKVNDALHECGQRVLTKEELGAFWEICGGDVESTKDRDTAYELKDKTRFRVNLHRHSGRLGAVLRLIKTNIPELSTLGVPTALLSDWLQQQSGFLLVTGPTGSGKSTTLASGLEWINEHMARHIVTIEDPIEYSFTSKRSYFTQREVGTDTPSFAAGLRSALRQAPDVIFLGEIRDAETALIGLQAAETGHLVFGTLHSATVADTLERLAHLIGPNDRESMLMLLSYQLIGILSQQLLPNAGGNGLTLVCEHLEVQAAVRDWIRDLKLGEIETFMRRKDNPRNQTFLNALVEAYQAGTISHETALAHSGNTYEFSRMLRGISS